MWPGKLNKKSKFLKAKKTIARNLVRSQVYKVAKMLRSKIRRKRRPLVSTLLWEGRLSSKMSAFAFLNKSRALANARSTFNWFGQISPSTACSVKMATISNKCSGSSSSMSIVAQRTHPQSYSVFFSYSGSLTSCATKVPRHRHHPENYTNWFNRTMMIITPLTPEYRSWNRGRRPYSTSSQ